MVTQHASAGISDVTCFACGTPRRFFFPVGAMFWARTEAIAPLLEIRFEWSDYPPATLAYDGTMLHAIERLLPVVVQHCGLEIAGTYLPGVAR